MEENQNQNTATTPQTTTTTAAPASTVTKSDAQPQTPVIPDGYVKAEELNTLRSQLSEIQTQLATEKANVRQASIHNIATRLGFNDVSDASLFVGSDVTDIEGALATILESKPYLKKAASTPAVTPTSPTNPARSTSQAPTFTTAQIADRSFWNSNKDAIMRAVKEGRITS